MPGKGPGKDPGKGLGKGPNKSKIKLNTVKPPKNSSKSVKKSKKSSKIIEEKPEEIIALTQHEKLQLAFKIVRKNSKHVFETPQSSTTFHPPALMSARGSSTRSTRQAAVKRKVEEIKENIKDNRLPAPIVVKTPRMESPQVFSGQELDLSPQFRSLVHNEGAFNNHPRKDEIDSILNTDDKYALHEYTARNVELKLNKMLQRIRRKVVYIVSYRKHQLENQWVSIDAVFNKYYTLHPERPIYSKK